jgi:DNA helicase IV
VTDDADIVEEQAFLDRSYEALDVMRDEARFMLDGVLDTGKGGTFQSRTERDIVVRTSLARLEQLEVGDQALAFGRIDVDRGPEQTPEVFHIGRLAVSDEQHEPLIVDWRAPVAEPFYRATGLDPQGLVRRRHLAVHRRQVTGVEDEWFSARQEGRASAEQPSDEGALAEGLELGGPGALLAALGQARTGHMADIVGTIQREQDEIIRATLSGILMVQGGPGTGKTAVALHRAAYLLYTHRFPLERQGVLVVGPNPLFLRYIEQVLPSLGETGVTLSTISGLVPEIRVSVQEPEEIERLKGDPKMVRVMARAVRTRQRPLREDLSFPFGALTLRLNATQSDAIVRRARRRPGTHNARRRFVESEVSLALAEQFQARRGLDLSDEEFNLAEFSQQLRAVPELRAALQRMWPRLLPHEVLHDLYGAPALVRVAAQGILSDEECALLHRPRSSALDKVLWTAGDAALVDELRTILGPRRGSKERRRSERRDDQGWPRGLDGHEPEGLRHEEEEVHAYGHIVVDETQDLTPMQLRMLARRSLAGSMTLVGDIAQATGALAPKSWEAIVEHLKPKRPPKLVELTVSYRTPAEVIELSKEVLAAADVGLQAPVPVRRSGAPPVIEQVPADQLLAAVLSATEQLRREVAPGHVAVLAPRALLGALRQAFDAAAVDVADPISARGPGLSAPLVLLAVEQANGLEFDAVLIVEPAIIAARGAAPDEPVSAPSARGLKTLYVAMTRPTKRLWIVGTRPFPIPLAHREALGVGAEG